MYAVLGGRPYNSQTIWRTAIRSRTHVDAIRVAHSVGPAAWVVPAPRVGQIRHRCRPNRSGHIGETDVPELRPQTNCRFNLCGQ